MSETTPGPDNTEPIPAEPRTTPTPTADETATATTGTAQEPTAPRRPRRAGDLWQTRRAPILIAAAALVLGCLCGGGAVAVGAFVIGHHGDGRMYSTRDDRGDNGGPLGPGGPGGVGRGDRRHGERPAPGATPPAPAPTASAPGAASAAPPAPTPS